MFLDICLEVFLELFLDIFLEMFTCRFGRILPTPQARKECAFACTFSAFLPALCYQPFIAVVPSILSGMLTMTVYLVASMYMYVQQD